MRRTALITASAVAIALVALSAPRAQQPAPAPAITQGASGIKRIPLQKFDVPGTALETVIAIAEIGPNVSVGRHTHPGVESGYIMDGDATLLVDGQPAKPLKAGDSYVVPAGTIHDAKAGAKGAKAIVTYVVEKGKPFATPAK